MEGFLIVDTAARLLRVFEVVGTEAVNKAAVSLLQLRTSCCLTEVTCQILVH